MQVVVSSSPTPGCAASLAFVWRLATYVQPSRTYATYGGRYRRALLLRWGLLKGEDQIFASSQATPTPQGGGKLTPLLTTQQASCGTGHPNSTGRRQAHAPTNHAAGFSRD